MLTLDLVPGVGLGQFVLGMAVGEVLSLAAENAEAFSRVDAKVSEDADADILLSLPAHGVNLRFDACSQALRLVEVHDPSRLQLRYKSEVVGGASPVTLQRVSALFGPTYPGEACGDGLLALHYRGLVFLFSQNAAGAQDVSAARIILCAPAAHAGSLVRLDAVLAAAPPVASPPAPLVAVAGFGLRLPGGAALPFGASLQDLVAELGPPTSSMVKGSDAMLIHASAQTTGPSSEPYFLTWQHRGLDVLIDGEVSAHALACTAARRLTRASQTHRCVKFVFHTNAPCHASFGAYTKAVFVLETASGARLDADAHWQDVQAALGPNERPAVNTGPSSAAGHGGAAHPAAFGPTFVYAYSHVVFEVMRNGRLASVTLFMPRQTSAALPL
jgi:hypothetical protein